MSLKDENLKDENSPILVLRESDKLPQKVKFIDLFKFSTRREIILIIMSTILATISGAVFPLTTVVFGDLIDDFGKWQARSGLPGEITPQDLVSKVSSTCLYFVYLSIITFIATYLYMSISVYTSLMAAHRIRQKYLKAVLRQDMTYFDKIGAGEVATRITSDTLLIQDAIGEKLPLAFSSLATFVSGLIIAFVKSWKLTLVLLCAVPFIGVTAALMNVIGSRFQVRIQELYSNSGNIAEETIAAARTVTAFNGQRKVIDLYNASLAGARKEGIKKFKVTGICLGFLSFFIYCSYSLCFWFGSIMLEDGSISTGSVVNVFFAVLIGAFALGNIAPDLQAFSIGVGAATKIFDTIDKVPTIDAYSTDGIILQKENVGGRLVFKNVKFTYPSRPNVPVLKSFSLEIKPGETLALVGQSGSGKSTIVQLIERFYDPDNGMVELEGIPLSSINVRSLRQMIGLVSQEPVLFEGTVAENVAFGLCGSDYESESWEKKLERVKNACMEANAHDFILNLPQQYDTQVGERGLLLSGGQKQRIAIARAIVKDPKILLLDEATSALDTTSEKIVQLALDKVSKTRTTVCVAHRLSTIKNANKIVVMVRGEIVEEGDHTSLLEKDGLYAHLVRAQDVDQKEEEKRKAENQGEGDKVLAVNASSNPQENQTTSPADLESNLPKVLTSWQVVKEVAQLNSPELKFIIPGVIAALGAGMIYPFFAISFGTIINVFAKRGPTLKSDSNFWSIIFLVIAVAAFIFAFFQNAFFGFSAEYLTERVRRKTFKAIVRQDIAFFDKKENTTGALTSNLSSDAQAIQGIAGLTLGSFLNVSFNLLGNIVVSFVFGWKLAAVSVCALPVLLATGIFRLRILTYFSDLSKVAYERSAQVACESVAAIRTVQSLNRENGVHQHYLDMLEKPLKDGTRNAFLNTIFYALSQSINFLVNALVFWYGGILIAYENYDIQQFFTVFVAIVFGSNGAARIFAYAPDMSKARAAGQSIVNLINSVPRIDSESKDGDSFNFTQGSVRFDNVFFNYPNRPSVRVLRGLNLDIPHGKFAALVGTSGCGKSTTIGLLERFYEVNRGKITIDGKDISSMNLNNYRNQIGLVSQEPNLFDMTIRENICFGCDYIPSMDEIEKAARDANIHDFIMTLPEKYETRVGKKAGRLSGGQKQRIAIARALIRNPKILLLDEATSALDAESEHVVQEALDKASEGRTTISIAHRLSTIQKADIIFVLQDGVVKEKGTASELFALKGAYYELAVQQNLLSI